MPYFSPLSLQSTRKDVLVISGIWRCDGREFLPLMSMSGRPLIPVMRVIPGHLGSRGCVPCPSRAQRGSFCVGEVRISTPADKSPGCEVGAAF